jgi:hypothetical protein
MAVDDSSVVPLWVEGRITPLTLEMYEDEVPRGTRLPVVVIKLQGPGRDISYNNNQQALLETVWQIAVTTNSTWYGDVADAAAELHALLEGKTGTNIGPGWDIISCRRQGRIRMQEYPQGIPHVRLGGLYRVQVCRSSQV